MYDQEDPKKEKMPALSPQIDRGKDKQTWRHMIENFAAIQKSHGIEVIGGVWHLVDEEKAKERLEPYKSWLRELLEEKKAQGKFKVGLP